MLKQAIILSLFIITTLTTSCSAPNTVIPSSQLSKIFNQTIGLVSYEQALINLIQNGNPTTLQDFFWAQRYYLIPLWSLAAFTFILFIGFCVQLCCYNCCRVSKCGNKMSFHTYQPCRVSCQVYLYMFFGLAIIAVGTASFILSSDLIKTSSTTLCNANNAYNQIFMGSPAGQTPFWSGVNNFVSNSQKVALNFPNVMPTLNQIFTSSTYDSLINVVNPNSLYNKVNSTFQCLSNFQFAAVPCPFADSTNCVTNNITNNPAQQIPLFSFNYCNLAINTSARALILSQQVNNATRWRDNLLSLNTQINSAITTPPDFTQLTSKATSLASSIQNYQADFNRGITTAKDNFYYAQIGSYSVASFFILLGVLSFFSIFCVFCSRNYSCRLMLYPMWICFGILAFLFYLISSVLLFGSFTSFATCKAYYVFTATNSSYITNISFYNNSQISQVMNTCFFLNKTGTIFNAFNSTTNLPAVQNINNAYIQSQPASTFSTVVTQIQYNIIQAAANPALVELLAAQSNQQPSQALNNTNTFSSTNGGNCGTPMIINDTFVYDPTLCSSPINQNPPSPSCLVIGSQSTSIVSSRQTLFTNGNCPNNFNTYNNNYQALLNFGTTLKNLAGVYLGSNTNPGIQTYLSAYQAYYNQLQLLMNSYTQTLFQSFITPYQQLLQGSSCSFLTNTINSLVDNTCNSNFPYIYAISILITLLAVLFFFMFILGYCLTTKMQFYVHIGGDLQNYNPDQQQQKQVQIQMAEINLTGKSQSTSRQPFLK